MSKENNEDALVYLEKCAEAFRLAGIPEDKIMERLIELNVAIGSPLTIVKLATMNPDDEELPHPDDFIPLEDRVEECTEEVMCEDCCDESPVDEEPYSKIKHIMLSCDDVILNTLQGPGPITETRASTLLMLKALKDMYAPKKYIIRKGSLDSENYERMENGKSFAVNGQISDIMAVN